MKMLFKCEVCGKVLGTYDGEDFFIRPSTPDAKVVCRECNEKEEAEK